MHGLVLLLIFNSLCAEYLAKQGWAPGLLTYFPEAVGLAVAAVVVFEGARGGFRLVRPAYWIAFGALVVVVACSAIAHKLGVGPLFAGIRTYLRALPLFFLPAVVRYSDRQLRLQLILILLFSLMQLPIAFHQRLSAVDAGLTTGDTTTGTLMNSAMLSIFQICVASVWTAWYLRGRTRLSVYLIVLGAVLVPTMINETKGTLVLLPVALFLTFLAAAKPGTRIRNATIGGAVVAMAVAVFIPVYDYFVMPRWGYGIVEFLTSEDKVEYYLSKDAELGSEKAGRLDALAIPIKELAKEPSHLVFGLGLGNATDSALGPQFSGEYFRRFEPFLLTAATTLVLEIGVLGLLLVMGIHWLIFQDARILARKGTDLRSVLALGWIAVTVVITAGLFYKGIMASNALSYLFWYFSGVVATERMLRSSGVSKSVSLPAAKHMIRSPSP